MAAVTGFFHAGVTVRDMDAALRFYRDGLGLELLSRSRADAPESWRIWALEAGGTAEVAFLRVPGTRALIELFAFSGIERHTVSARPCDPAFGHFCLFTDDAEGLRARAIAAGGGARSEVQTIAAGPLGGSKVVYVLDPDGYSVELIERPPRD